MILITPIVVFAFMIATLMGAVCHLLVGGDVKRLALFFLASWVGFGLGQGIGVAFRMELLTIGTLRFPAAVVTAILLLIITILFTTAQKRQRRTLG